MDHNSEKVYSDIILPDWQGLHLRGMLKREVLIAACVGKDERTYNREAEWNKMKMIMRIQAFIYQEKLTMCSTNLEQKISKKKSKLAMMLNLHQVDRA